MNIGQCICPTEYAKLFCLPNTNDTSALELPLLKTLPDSFEIIRRRIRGYAQQQYDFALLDCPPNMGFFAVSALHASDFVIVPIWAGSAFSVEGLLKAVDLINDIRANGNADLRFLRLLINQKASPFKTLMASYLPNYALATSILPRASKAVKSGLRNYGISNSKGNLLPFAA
jgi:cellulose biosynthesis protein BcsQ